MNLNFRVKSVAPSLTYLEWMANRIFWSMKVICSAMSSAERVCTVSLLAP